MTKVNLYSLPRRQESTSTTRRIALLITLLVILSTLVPSTTALPILDRRRNPLTIGLGLGGRPVGHGGAVSVGLGEGGPFLDLRHILHVRGTEPETNANTNTEAEYIANTNLALEKRSGPPATGTDADSTRLGDAHIWPMPPATRMNTPLGESSGGGGEGLLEKRGRLPPGPGSGGEFDKDKPYNRR
ncbi:hypothetical protein BGX29_009653 [Mortierella sp. GBA35]|nr:hypothetical protein BGX29_009653 [Mortierella sp. GBA35]